MLDQLSNYPAPEYFNEKNNIKKCFKQNHTLSHNHMYISDINLDKFIEDAFKEHVIMENNKITIKYSYSGWYIYGIKDVKKDVNTAIIQHKKKTKQKIIGVLKALALLHSIYKNTLDKLYNPDNLSILIKNKSIDDIKALGGLNQIILDNLS